MMSDVDSLARCHALAVAAMEAVAAPPPPIAGSASGLSADEDELLAGYTLAERRKIAAASPPLRAAAAAPLRLRPMGRADSAALAVVSGTDADRLAMFTPKARARILAVLDRLPGLTNGPVV